VDYQSTLKQNFLTVKNFLDCDRVESICLIINLNSVFIDVTKKKEYVIINNPDELKALYEANSKDIWA